MWLEKIPRGRRLWNPTLAQKAAQGWGTRLSRSRFGLRLWRNSSVLLPAEEYRNFLAMPGLDLTNQGVSHADPLPAFPQVRAVPPRPACSVFPCRLRHIE